MAAKFSEKDGFFTMTGNKVDPYLHAHICNMFDEMTDVDEDEIRLDMKEEKYLRSECLVKTLLFPFDIFLSLLFMERHFVQQKMEGQKIYWMFLRKKITLEELKALLMKGLV